VAASIPTIEPQQFRAGDTIKWNRTFSDYAADAGWTLAYRLLSTTKGYDVNGALITSTGGTFNIVIPAATSKTYLADEYSWVAFVTKGSERYTVAKGRLKILPDIAAQIDGYDDRSANKKILDAIDALISGAATSDVQQYRIGSRELTKMNRMELLKFRAVYASKVRAERIQNGETVPSNSYGIRFGGQ
jgi:hypothetical protein